VNIPATDLVVEFSNVGDENKVPVSVVVYTLEVLEI